MAEIKTEMVSAKRIGFMADTHCSKDDGSDLPQQAMDAFAGVDLIVSLGHAGKPGVIKRLGTIAPVLDLKPGNSQVIVAGGVSVGLIFELHKAGIPVKVEEPGTVDLLGQPAAEVAASRFGTAVDAVAFGGTHKAISQTLDGVLFFNPGSGRLPSDKPTEDDLGSVAILDVSSGEPRVELVRLRP